VVGYNHKGSNRVKRGGNWNNNPNNMRASNRNNNNPTNRNNNIGFRLALFIVSIFEIRQNGCDHGFNHRPSEKSTD